VGAWLAGAARLEAASVPAFAQLARELAAHGAPAALVARARLAWADEIRHFGLMRALARRHGQDATPPRPPLPDVRPLAEVARENAVEGCVRETWSALVASWQACRAGDGAVRAALAEIAEDEATHGQLAWDVAAWANARLARRQRRVIRQALAGAADELAAGAGAEVEPALVAALGLPDARTSEVLAARARATLWAA
jgi:hypothetical protein